MYRHPATQPSGLSTAFLRAFVGGARPMAGLSLAPDIPAKKLQGAQTFAAVTPGEQPVALVDTSVMQSGKSGMLFTDRAVYLDSPRARVPLEAITHPPVGASAQHVAHLPTAMGAITLPTSVPDESLAAMLALLRAVAFANRGASRFGQGHAPVPGIIGELAATTLRGPSVQAAPAIVRGAAHAASNLAHAWLDHDRGEELVCLLDDTASLDGTRGVAFTDRRLIAFGAQPLDLPYGAITGVSIRKGMLTNTFQLSTTSGAASFECLAEDAITQPIHAFLHGLGSIAPEQRHAGYALTRTADDPSAVADAMRALPQPDPRAATILEVVHASVAQGAVSADDGFDLTQRAVRLQRCLRGGHGRSGVMQRSPLAAADLCVAFSQLLGAPVHQGYEANGVVLDYDLGRSGSVAGTVASNVVGIALLAVVGVGWVSAGSGAPKRVRVRVWEGPGGAGFTLHDPSGLPLAKNDAKLAGALLGGLADLSATVLLRRAVTGWGPPLEALLAEPPAALEARVRALAPLADVALFMPG
ncbi:MAG: hypothetical protein R3A48_16510 [Polyangiales bacterium]